jgi:hypothetical protein
LKTDQSNYKKKDQASIEKDRALETARLDAARMAFEALKRNVSLSEADRRIFARNLGSMYENCKKVGAPNLNQLFIETFGQISGTNDYKKRSRLIHLTSDRNPAAKLCGKSFKFRQLALGMAKHISTPKQTTDQEKDTLAILRLIEGSSFDSTAAQRDRYDQEYRDEITESLNKLCNIVSRNVDLDWMYYWVKNHPLAAFGRTGNLESVWFSPNIDWREEEGSLEIHGPVNNCLAPCVRLGEVITPIHIDAYMDVEVEGTKEANAQSIREELTKILKLPELIDDEAELDVVPKMWNCDSWVEGDERPQTYKTKRYIDLELRYDATADLWRSCFFLRFDFKNGFYTLNLMDYIDNEGKDDILEVFTFDWGSCACLAKKLSDKTYRLFTVDTRDIYSSNGTGYSFSPANDSFRGVQDNNGINFTDPHFLDFLLSVSNSRQPEAMQYETDPIHALFGYEFWQYKSLIKFVDSDWGYDEWESVNNCFAKAPTGSIAYEILANLAYAPPEKRLDMLLIKDAQNKYKILKDYSEKLELRYEQAIAKL